MTETAWTVKEHHQRYGDNFNSGLIKYINDTLQPKKIIEFGCGVGWYCDYFSKNGGEIIYGIEPNLMEQKYFNGKNCIQIQIDLTKQNLPLNYSINDLDLFWSVEVMEHIERKEHSKLFDLFTSWKPKNIVFSGARIGQGGYGHIACRDEEDWRQEWTSRGYIFNKEMTMQARKLSNKKNVNHIKNIQIFNKF